MGRWGMNHFSEDVRASYILLESNLHSQSSCSPRTEHLKAGYWARVDGGLSDCSELQLVFPSVFPFTKIHFFVFITDKCIFESLAAQKFKTQRCGQSDIVRWVLFKHILYKWARSFVVPTKRTAQALIYLKVINCKSIQSYFWVITIIPWNISILIDMISSSKTMSCPQSTRRSSVWWLWKWYELYAITFTDTRSQLNTNFGPVCWTVLLMTIINTRNKEAIWEAHGLPTSYRLFLKSNYVLSYANNLVLPLSCAVSKNPQTWKSCKLLSWNRYLFFCTLDSANSIRRQIDKWCRKVVLCSFMFVFWVCIVSVCVLSSWFWNGRMGGWQHRQLYKRAGFSPVQ